MDVPDPDGTVVRLCTLARHHHDHDGTPGFLRPAAAPEEDRP
jgi:hypothetical protein